MYGFFKLLSSESVLSELSEDIAVSSVVVSSEVTLSFRVSEELFCEDFSLFVLSEFLKVEELHTLHIDIVRVFAEDFACEVIRLLILFTKVKESHVADFVFLEVVRIFDVFTILFGSKSEAVAFVVFFSEFTLCESRVRTFCEEFFEFIDRILWVYGEIYASIFHVCFRILSIRICLVTHLIE